MTLGTEATRSGSEIVDDPGAAASESHKSSTKEKKNDKKSIITQSWNLNEYRLTSEQYAILKKDKKGTDPETLEVIKTYNKI